MACITKEEVSEKRNAIKKAFPPNEGWKLSVVGRHYTEIVVSIMKAPYQMLEEGQSYEDINHYCLHEIKDERKRNDLERLYEIINKGNFDNSDYYKDYHHVGFYLSMSIGKWDKPFQVA